MNGYQLHIKTIVIMMIAFIIMIDNMELNLKFGCDSTSNRKSSVRELFTVNYSEAFMYS